MSFFSKLFGSSKPKTAPLVIPDGASSGDIIRIAIESVMQQAGGNCATLEVIADPDKWVQLMDLTINCHYPPKERPDWLFPELTNHPIVAGMEGYEEGTFMTVSLKEMNPPEIAAWIGQYFPKVLAVDLDNNPIRLRMEEL